MESVLVGALSCLLGGCDLSRRGLPFFWKQSAKSRFTRALPCSSALVPYPDGALDATRRDSRSEEHTSELQSLMRISYAVFCLKKKNNIQIQYKTNAL